MKFNYKKTDIYYNKKGTGSAVVLIHGFLENHKMWDGLVNKLKADHTVITVDLLGHGKSDGLCDVHTMEQQAKMVSDVMDKLDILKAVIIGHSMGGYITMAFSKLFPEKVSGLVLLNSHPFNDNEEKRHARERAIKTVKKNYVAYVKAAIPSFFAPDNRSKYKTVIDKLINEALEMKPENIIAALRGMMLRADRSELFCQQSRYPKMWIVGKKDPLMDADKVLDLANRCKNVDYIELSEGHMSYVENSEDMPEIIQRFLKRNNL